MIDLNLKERPRPNFINKTTKDIIWKVIFLTALANPVYGKGGVVRFHGKIDT
jgi:hypothetical protein